MQCSLRDVAFFKKFKVSQQVHKNNTIDKQPNFYQALRIVIYRYFKYILLPTKVISKVRTPFFPNYLEPTSDQCMYTSVMMKAWKSYYYERCGWYMKLWIALLWSHFCLTLHSATHFSHLIEVSLFSATRATTSVFKLTEGWLYQTTKVRASGRVVKPCGAKRKANDLVEEPLNDDIYIAATTAIDPPTPSTQDPIPPGSKRPNLHLSEEETLKSFTPPKIKSMSLTKPSSSFNLGSEVLIVNSSFRAMLKFKAKNNNKFSPTYAAFVAFLNKVPLYCKFQIFIPLSFACCMYGAYLTNKSMSFFKLERRGNFISTGSF